MSARAAGLAPAEALVLWRRALGDSLRREAPDLTLRQMAILLTVYTGAPPHTVRGLASGLAISKPAVTRALDRMGALGLIRRLPDPADGRNVLVGRTVKGSIYLAELADIIVAAWHDPSNGGNGV